MNPNEKKLEYPWGEALPAPGTAIDIVPGLKWVRLPLPFALDHVNVWLMRDQFKGRDGWTVIDCGISRDEVRAIWEQVFDNALEGLPIVRVLVTHMHPDHIGLADWLCQRWQAPLWMTMTDYFVANLWSTPEGRTAGPVGESAVEHFRRHGLSDTEALEKIRLRAGYYPDLVPSVPARFHRVLDGDTLQIGGRDWQVIVGHGHAPEHISLYSEALNVFIAGDMVLPRISTNVSVFDYEPDGDPLRLYLESLPKYERLPADALVLPSHGRPFKGLHERIAQQQAHHADRLQEVIEACAEPRCTAEIVPIMFRRELDLHQLTFAMGEALAHLNLLYLDGQLTRTTCDDGVVRFQVA